MKVKKTEIQPRFELAWVFQTLVRRSVLITSELQASLALEYAEIDTIQIYASWTIMHACMQV